MSFTLTDEMVKAASGRWQSRTAVVGLVFVVPAACLLLLRFDPASTWLQAPKIQFDSALLVAAAVVAGLLIIGSVVVGLIGQALGRLLLRALCDGLPFAIVPGVDRRMSRRAEAKRRRLRDKLDAYWKKADRGSLSDALYSELMDLRAHGQEGSDRAKYLLATRCEPGNSGRRRTAVRLGRSLRRIPVARGYLGPTVMANLFAAAEERLLRSKGLMMSASWPVFWLALDDDERKEIGALKGRIDDYCGAAVLLALIGPYAGIVSGSFLIGFSSTVALVTLGVVLCRTVVVRCAENFLALTSAGFLLHRADLVKASQSLSEQEAQAVRASFGGLL